MSDDAGDPPAEVGRWLRSLSAPPPGDGGVAPPAGGSVGEWVRRAAECYARAGWDEDACRVYDRLGDGGRSAPFHERNGRWERAAAGYEQAARWADAARCHEQAGGFEQAADCLLRAGDPLRAAWLLADRAGRHLRAEGEVQKVTAKDEHDRRLVELILARCDAAAGRAQEAAVRLRGVTEALPGLPPAAPRGVLLDWGLVVAERLGRPDLTAELFAAAVEAGLYHAERRWEAWALDVLGDATGVPPPREPREEAAADPTEDDPAGPLPKGP